MRFAKYLFLASLAFGAISTAAEPTTYQVVSQIFEAKCYNCHSTAKKQKSGLAMDKYELLLKGGDEGPAVVPGSLKESLISEYIHYPLDDEYHMPPPKKEQLEKEEIAIIDAWIVAGASTDQKLAESPLDKTLQTWAIANVFNKPAAPPIEKIPTVGISPSFEKDIAHVESIMENSIWRADKTGHQLCFTAVNCRDTMDDAMLAALTPLAPYFVDIDLSRTKITAPALQKFLTQATSLELLNLSLTKVGNAWIPEGDALPALKKLILFGTPLSADAATRIPRLKALTSLYVSNTGIPPADQEKLRKAIPGTIGDDFLAAERSSTEFPPSTPAAKPIGENLALNKPVTATAFYNAGTETFPAVKLTDGLGGDSGKPGDWSFWLANLGDLASVTLDLQTPVTVALIEFENTRNRHHGNFGLKDFTVEVSDDGKSFTKLIAGHMEPIKANEPKSFVSERFPVPPTKTRYLRVKAASYHGLGVGLNEIRVYSN